MMERNNNIPIRNIYYMLSYAYQTLNLSEYKQIGTESFENVKDLYAEILSIGIPVLVRGGLSKDYIGQKMRRLFYGLLPYFTEVSDVDVILRIWLQGLKVELQNKNPVTFIKYLLI